MDDLLDEREQWERVTAWVREQGPWVLAGIAVMAGVVGAWRYWQARTERRALDAGARYEQVIDAFSRSDFSGGLKLTAALVSDYPSSIYTDEAELAAARIEVDAKHPDQAIQWLKQVMDSASDPQLVLIARLRLARVQLDQGKPDEVLATLNGAMPGAFAARYDEIRGDALLAKGDRDGALKAYRTARIGANGTLDTDLLDLKINELTRS